MVDFGSECVNIMKRNWIKSLISELQYQLLLEEIAV
jgi:hypothetical protein